MFGIVLRNQRISIFKTLLINFKTLPIKQAIHLPIWVYSDTYLQSLGMIRIDNKEKIKSGMIRIGKRNFFKGYPSMLSNAGTIVFKGYTLIEAGTQIQNCGRIVFDEDSRLCECVKVLVVDNLYIGKSTQIAFEGVIMDTDFHYLINIENGEVKQSIKSIHIGSFNWSGNRTLFRKGTVTPDHTIIANNSILSKDYTNEGENILLAGQPAKCVKKGMRRLWRTDTSKICSQYFKENPTTSSYTFNDIKDWDAFTIGSEEYPGDNFLPNHQNW